MAKANKTIYAALLANLFIAVIKFIAGGISNSAAMISEGIHSLVDTINELLLLFGIRQSKKPPDATRPFGYGKEIFFWSFIVSILIFGLGGGISIYQGIVHIADPEPLGDPFWNYIVLAFSIVFEGISLVIAFKEFNAVRGNTPFWLAVRESKDPSSFVVLFEDGAAVIGLFTVLICVFLGHRFDIAYLDGIASLLVGLLLVAVSMILARESRSLLMGEGIAPDTEQKIRAMATRDEAVTNVQSILSTYQSPEEVVLMIIVTFKADLDTEGITDAIDRIRKSIKDTYSFVKFVIIQPQTT